MAELLIRNLEPEMINALKLMAKRHHRSLQGELKAIIEAATKMSVAEAQQITSSWKEQLAGRTFTDSTELLREDRDKR